MYLLCYQSYSDPAPCSIQKFGQKRSIKKTNMNNTFYKILEHIMDFNRPITNLELFVTVVAIVLLYYFVHVCQQPKIIAGNGRLETFLRTHVPIVGQKFRPTFFYWEGRLQTYFSLTKRIKASERLPYEREIFTLPDGGQIGIDYLKPPPNIQEKLLVILLPGLTSSSRTSYVKTLALSIANYGGGMVAVVNNRGLGGVTLKTPRTFCAANCDDLRVVINHLHEKFPFHEKIAIGTSLGGMVLAHYLIEHKEESRRRLKAAMLVSVIYDAWSATHSIEKPINLQIFNYQLAQSLLHLAKKYRPILDGHDCFDYSKILKSRTLREIDASYTAPQFGYKTVEDYYNHVTVSDRIHKILIPVVGLSAMDDPLMPGKDLPTKQAAHRKSNFAFIVTKRGGHLGFLEGWLPRMKKYHYMEKVVGQFVKAVRLQKNELEFVTHGQCA